MEPPLVLYPRDGRGAPCIWSPDDVSLNIVLEEHVIAKQEDMMPPNTQVAYKPKVTEYMQFCKHVYGNDCFKYNMINDKVLRFMFYISFREQKPCGGNKKKTAAVLVRH